MFNARQWCHGLVGCLSSKQEIPSSNLGGAYFLPIVCKNKNARNRTGDITNITKFYSIQHHFKLHSSDEISKLFKVKPRSTYMTVLK